MCARPSCLSETVAKRFHYGGQAVLEGVMMRGRTNVAIAVRRREGDIVVRQDRLGTWATSRWARVPLLRGPVVLVETLILGMRALYYSAAMALEEDGEQQVGAPVIWGAAAFGMVLAVGLFVALPLLIVHFIDPFISATLSNVADGVIRLIVFLLYLNVITLIPDIRRVFAYHGAEHKTINAYEAGEDLEVERARLYGTAHSRCGTGFILIVLVIAILAHAFLGRPAWWLRFLERLAILPLIGAFSYELMKFFADHMKNWLVRISLAPGLALQAMTTREPDDGQLEVAITALRTVLAADGQAAAQPPAEAASPATQPS